MFRQTICVVGGGSVAHALVAILGRPENEVRVLTRRPELWGSCVQGFYRDLVVEGRLACASSSAAEAIPGAGIIMIAAPFCAHRELLAQVRPYVDPEAWIGGFPGFGGFDWQARQILGPAAILFGLQRIPYVCHKIEYGRKVAITGIRPQLFMAALPAGKVNEIAATLEGLLHTRVVPTGNYLNITLSTSNPIMNPARIYGLFQDWLPGRRYDRCPSFYGEWDELSTELYLRCDDEIHAVCRALAVDVGYVKALVQHFEVATRQDITDKIRGLGSLKHRPSPLRQTEDGSWEPDFNHPYFREDIPFGIVIQRAVAEIARVPTPMLDEIITWAQEVLGAEYLAGNRIAGRDAAGLPIPQNLGIDTLDELVRRAFL